MRQTTARKVPISARVSQPTRNAIQSMANTTKITRSNLIELALNQFIQNPPTDLPLEIHAQIARAKMQQTINTIKDILWTYHRIAQAQIRIEKIQQQTNLPPHTQTIIQKLEQQIIQQQQQLDSLIKQAYNQGEQQ